MAGNATARRFRRKVSCEMQVRLPAQTTHAKIRVRGGIGGQVLAAVVLFYFTAASHLLPASVISQMPRSESDDSKPSLTIALRVHCAVFRQRG
jgi:hypothetical protein